jgi:hypothetical protein
LEPDSRPFEISDEEAGNMVSALTSTTLNGMGEIVDHSNKASTGKVSISGRLSVGGATAAIDLGLRSTDDEGLTVRDVVAVGGSILGGVVTGAGIGAMGGNPVTAFAGGIIGGGLVAFGIDNFPGTDPGLAAVTVSEYDPKTGLTTTRTFIPNGFVWIDGVKVDVLHVTEVTTDPTGIVGRTTYSLEVTDAAEALGLIRDYAESQVGAQGTGLGPSDPNDPRGPSQIPGAPGDRTGSGTGASNNGQSSSDDARREQA